MSPGPEADEGGRLVSRKEAGHHVPPFAGEWAHPRCGCILSGGPTRWPEPLPGGAGVPIGHPMYCCLVRSRPPGHLCAHHSPAQAEWPPPFFGPLALFPSFWSVPLFLLSLSLPNTYFSRQTNTSAHCVPETMLRFSAVYMVWPLPLRSQQSGDSLQRA